jgi:hypothetical protein
MKSRIHRFVAALAGAGLAVVATAAPAVASTADNRFDLSAGSASAYGTYDHMMSIPERPVPPVLVTGTLAVNKPKKCAVAQIAYNGPADGIEWRTLTTLCGPGKTNFKAQSGYLWGGAQPQLRLCVGKSLKWAKRGIRCDVHTPPPLR